MPAGEFVNEYQVDENQYGMNGNQPGEYQDQDEMVRGGANLDVDGAYVEDDMQPGPACQAHYDHPEMGMTEAQQRDPRQYAFLPPCFTQKIAPAGKVTFASESVFDILKMQN